LKDDLEITGRIYGKIYLTSNLQETDIAVRLTDLYPDGRSILIADGLTHIEGKAEEPHTVYVDLWSTSMVFAKGHRIRISISNSNYPQYDSKLTEGQVKDIIHLGGDLPSALFLPIVN
jgi:uncharacterized protein